MREVAEARDVGAMLMRGNSRLFTEDKRRDLPRDHIRLSEMCDGSDSRTPP